MNSPTKQTSLFANYNFITCYATADSLPRHHAVLMSKNGRGENNSPVKFPLLFLKIIWLKNWEIIQSVMNCIWYIVSFGPGKEVFRTPMAKILKWVEHYPLNSK